MQTTRDVKADPVDGSVVVTLTVTLKLPIDASSEVGRLVFGKLGDRASGSAPCPAAQHAALAILRLV